MYGKDFVCKMQWNAVITWSNITWFCKHHCTDWGRINRIFKPQKTLHISPYHARYEVSFLKILEKIDRVITAPHCIKTIHRLSNTIWREEFLWYFMLILKMPIGLKNIKDLYHYSDVVMGAMASQIISLAIIYSTVHSGADQRKHQSSASLAFVPGIHRWPVKSPEQMASNAENVSIWWRHHAMDLSWPSRWNLV